MKAKYTASQIAQWFINRAAEDVVTSGGEYLTHLKLQKLLYYAQGAVLALTENPLFDDQISHWTHGPVVKSVYQEYKHYGTAIIDSCKEIKIDSDIIKNILEQVYDVFGAFSALKLRDLTHAETPWASTELNEEIPIDIIKDYFKQHYIED